MNFLGLLSYKKEDQGWLAAVLNRQAAEWLLQAGDQNGAAECWIAAGDTNRAVYIYRQLESPAAVAPVLLDLGQWDEAALSYRAWLADLMPGDISSEVRARLGLAACLELRGKPDDVREARKEYRLARALIEFEKSEDLTAGECWEALGEYGVRLKRFDLIQIGYERALSFYQEHHYDDQVRAARNYWMAVVGGNHLLAVDLAQRIKKWFSGSTSGAAWQTIRERMSILGFSSEVQNVDHFMQAERQWAIWKELSNIAGHPEQEQIDQYLSSLAPESMVYIPAGSFQMGAEISDTWAELNEKPAHPVFLTGYYLSACHVTNGQYGEFMASNGYEVFEYWEEAAAIGLWRRGSCWNETLKRWQNRPVSWGENRAIFSDWAQRPVVGVTWYESLAYCRWRGGRLPTEAEWEKAVGWNPVEGVKRLFGKWAIFDQFDRERFRSTVSYPLPVGIPLLGESAYGVQDILGNVTEWCSSRFWAYPYKSGDGREELVNSRGVVRAIRGVSAIDFSSPKSSRCTFRGWGDPATSNTWLSFRVVLPG